jgi:hypothetical protein
MNFNNLLLNITSHVSLGILAWTNKLYISIFYTILSWEWWLHHAQISWNFAAYIRISTVIAMFITSISSPCRSFHKHDQKQRTKARVSICLERFSWSGQLQMKFPIIASSLSTIYSFLACSWTCVKCSSTRNIYMLAIFLAHVWIFEVNT